VFLNHSVKVNICIILSILFLGAIIPIEVLLILII
jgi:hypothetical protein